MTQPSPGLVLDEGLAGSMMRIGLRHVAREYPHLLSHILEDATDLLPPRTLHPVFFGSFDWHSCVHGWWMLLTLRRLYPHLGEARAIADLADDTFTEGNVAGERVYLCRPSAATFERPYGWAWLLTLHLESSWHEDKPWAVRLAPLARAFAGAFPRYLAMLTYPIRAGTHGNSAFAAVLALAWADKFDPGLARLLRRRARDWFAADVPSEVAEPGGDAFLSPTLIEALCMARCLPPPEAVAWVRAWLPRVAQGEPAALLAPATVSSRHDGKIVHLDGLNLSRGWCWRALAPLLPPAAERVALRVADEHLASALPHLAEAYAGEHWLASFALLALLEGGADYQKKS
jgi:hypothetical protein